MNSIKKGKKQLYSFAFTLLLAGVVLFASGVVMTVLSLLNEVNVFVLVFGIIFTVLSTVAIGLGIFFIIMSKAVKATDGSIAEDNIEGTVNIHKCSNCGQEIEEGKNICAECEENLKK